MSFSAAMTPRDKYLELLDSFRRLHRASTRRLWYLRVARSGLLYATLGIAALLYFLSHVTLSAAVSGLALVWATAAVINVLEVRLSRQWKSQQRMIRICRTSLARLDHDWDGVPRQKVATVLSQSPLAIDLDLFGPGSLMQLICVAETDVGRRTFSDWLVHGVTSDQIDARQRFAQVLSERESWRLEFRRRCMAVDEAFDRTEELVTWASGVGAPQVPRYVRGYALLVPLLILGSLVVTAVLPPAIWLLLATIFANFIITVMYSGEIYSHFGRVSAGGGTSNAFDALSQALSHLRQLRELSRDWPAIRSAGEQGAVGLKPLERVLRAESLSRNSLTYIYLYLPLQFVFLWDQQMLRLANRWRHASGQQVKHWVDALGEMEAVNCLATVAYEHPAWTFPVIESSGQPRFEAKELGHPLLPDHRRVTNDLAIGPPGSIMLITGSNMGGKSTILRTIGVNIVLAQAGAPCCCHSLNMSAFRLQTSITTTDSLHNSTSLFMAQLKNLKRVIDVLQEDDSSKTPVIYLFDEILNGTNTTDRRIVVEGLVRLLLKSNAIGVMTTHDLEIASSSPQRESFDNYYMGHQVCESSESPRDQLSYDYKLRPGVAPKSNALALARMLGISCEQA